MPSKVRYVLSHNGEIYSGSAAIARMCHLVNKNLFNIALPFDWLSVKTVKKITFLAKFLPPKTNLYILRVPKWTRRNKSKYHKLLQGKYGVGLGNVAPVQANPLQAGFQVAVPGAVYLIPNANAQNEIFPPIIFEEEEG